MQVKTQKEARMSLFHEVDREVVRIVNDHVRWQLETGNYLAGNSDLSTSRYDDWVYAGLYSVASILDGESVIGSFSENLEHEPESEGRDLYKIIFVTESRIITISEPEQSFGGKAHVTVGQHGGVTEVAFAPRGAVLDDVRQPFPGRIQFSVKFACGIELASDTQLTEENLRRVREGFLTWALKSQLPPVEVSELDEAREDGKAPLIRKQRKKPAPPFRVGPVSVLDSVC
jgi:hypothetical protein